MLRSATKKIDRHSPITISHPYLFNMIRGYNAYTNVRINTRDTAMLTGETIKLTKVTRLPSEQGIAAYCLGVWIVNIYGPSGSSNRQER